jgi:hypothetical protein
MSLQRYFQKNFTKEEQGLLKRLGIKLDAHPEYARDKTKRTTAPKPYILKTLVHCRLCGKNTVRFYSMELDETDYVPVLRARPISLLEAEQRDEVIRSQRLNPSTCPVCFETIMKWKKEDLAKKLIKAFPLANR